MTDVYYWQMHWIILLHYLFTKLDGDNVARYKLVTEETPTKDFHVMKFYLALEYIYIDS